MPALKANFGQAAGDSLGLFSVGVAFRTHYNMVWNNYGICSEEFPLKPSLEFAMLPLFAHLFVAFMFFLRQEELDIPGIAMALLSTLAVGFLVLSYAITRHFTLFYNKRDGSVIVALAVGFFSLLAPRLYNYSFLVRDRYASTLFLVAGILFAFSRRSIVEAIRTRVNLEGSDAMKMVRNFPPRSSDDISTLRLLACAMYLLPLLAEFHWSNFLPKSH